MGGLLGLVEAAITLAATSPEELRLSASESLSPPSLVWAHASGMATPLMHALTVWTKEGTSLGKGVVNRSVVAVVVVVVVVVVYY